MSETANDRTSINTLDITTAVREKYGEVARQAKTANCCAPGCCS